MRTFSPAAMLTAVVFSTACAQQGPGPGMGPGAMGAGHQPMFGSDYTAGWSMMSPEERDEHRRRMMGARTPEECRKIRDENAQRMNERARAQGMGTMPMPMRDACSGMQP